MSGNENNFRISFEENVCKLEGIRAAKMCIKQGQLRRFARDQRQR
jgi:hypothetical protein